MNDEKILPLNLEAIENEIYNTSNIPAMTRFIIDHLLAANTWKQRVEANSTVRICNIDKLQLQYSEEAVKTITSLSLECFTAPYLRRYEAEDAYNNIYYCLEYGIIIGNYFKVFVYTSAKNEEDLPAI